MVPFDCINNHSTEPPGIFSPERVSRKLSMSKSTKILLVAALLLAITAAALLYYSSAVFLQLFIAFALAYVLNPAVELL